MRGCLKRVFLRVTIQNIFVILVTFIIYIPVQFISKNLVFQLVHFVINNIQFLWKLFIIFQNVRNASLDKLNFLEKIRRYFRRELSLRHLHFDFFHCKIKFSLNQYFNVLIVIFNAGIRLFLVAAFLIFTVIFCHFFRLAFYLAALGFIWIFTDLIFFFYFWLFLLFSDLFLFLVLICII